MRGLGRGPVSNITRYGSGVRRDDSEGVDTPVSYTSFFNLRCIADAIAPANRVAAEMFNA